MHSAEFSRPFPDYVICPQCHEPEVEVWCYALQATCHNCGHIFDHPLPSECRSTCTAEIRDRAAQIDRSLTPPRTCAELLDQD
jgi:rubredoxin